MTAAPQISEPPITEEEAPLILDPSEYPSVDHLITEDDTPVDNVFAAKQQRLLVEPLYATPVLAGRTFIADANVGVFASIYKSAIVPDAFLSLNIQLPPNFREKRYRSYFLWEYGKPPDVVIELISDLRGEELGEKMQDYAQIGVRYYAIFDPDRHFKGPLLRTYGLNQGTYQELSGSLLETVGLGLKLWEGTYEGSQDTWLRWCDPEGQVIPTGAEYAEQERLRAEQERLRAEQADQRAEQADQRAEQADQRAEQANQLAEQERLRAERLLAQLRALGIEPQDEVK